MGNVKYKIGDKFKLINEASGQLPKDDIWTLTEDKSLHDDCVRLHCPRVGTWAFYERRLGVDLIRINKRTIVIMP